MGVNSVLQQKSVTKVCSKNQDCLWQLTKIENSKIMSPGSYFLIQTVEVLFNLSRDCGELYI